MSKESTNVSDAGQDASHQEQVDQLYKSFIDKANEHTDSFDLGAISSALLAASAQFGAFYIASACESRKELKNDKDDISARFVGEFKRELLNSLDDYIENYKVYMREDP